MTVVSEERPRTVRGQSADSRAPRPRTVAVEKEKEKEKEKNYYLSLHDHVPQSARARRAGSVVR